jgi:pimeloyl-ACP methyl ester carboxylesterase
VGTDPKVTALVYVAARAPDAGEDFVALSEGFPTMPARAGVQEHDGFTRLSEEVFLKYFANGIAREKAEVLYAVQEPTAASLFSGRTTVAAWRSKPTFCAVSKDDQTISPDLERFLAARMKAKTVELEAGHLSLVSHPQEIADLILAAAGRKKWRLVNGDGHAIVSQSWPIGAYSLRKTVGLGAGTEVPAPPISSLR